MSRFRKVQVLIPILILALVSVSLPAQTMKPKRAFNENEDGNYVGQALRLLMSENGDRNLSNLTGAEIRKALDVVSVARQQQAYVRRSELTSMLIPGAGQFMNHDAAAGALFLGGHLAVVAGTLVGAYFLLPSDLQFTSINYFTDSFDAINKAWMGHSFVQYLPSMAVAAGGMLLDHVIRHFAAENAGDLARQNIKDKKVTFQPEPFMVFPGPRGPKMGFGWRMRF